MSSKRRLTPQQKLMAEYYLTGMSATQAAIKAGYSPHYANREAAKLVVKPQVLAYIDELSALADDCRSASLAERRAFWTRVMNGEVPAKMADRLKASELLGKSHGDFIDRKEESGKIEVEITRKVVHVKD